jgi:hypothetical protein
LTRHDWEPPPPFRIPFRLLLQWPLHAQKPHSRSAALAAGAGSFTSAPLPFGNLHPSSPVNAFTGSRVLALARRTNNRPQPTSPAPSAFAVRAPVQCSTCGRVRAAPTTKARNLLYASLVPLVRRIVHALLLCRGSRRQSYGVAFLSRSQSAAISSRRATHGKLIARRRHGGRRKRGLYGPEAAEA